MMIFRLVLLLQCCSLIFGANILFLNSWNSKSHALTMKPLMERLNDDGHNVTLHTLTGYKIGPIGNKIHSVESLVQNDDATEIYLAVQNAFWYEEMEPDEFNFAFEYSHSYMRATTKDENLLGILATKFDLVIIDDMFPPAQATIAEYQKMRYGAKIATFPTTDIMQITADYRGFGRNPITVPNFHAKGFRTEYDVTLFWDRLANFRDVLVENFHFRYECESWVQKSAALLSVKTSQQKMYRDSYYHFADYPELLLMATPKTTQAISVGQNCKGSKPLGDELAKFVDDPKSKGTIYIAFGSIVNWKYGPEHIRHTFVKVFNAMSDYRIIWSYQDEELTEALPHIKFLSWAPQNDILAHNKTVLFFTHGGIKSFKEGLCAGVPMLFLPFFADQPKNALLAKHWGLAQSIYKKNVTEVELSTKVHQVLDNPEYGNRGRKFRSLYLDLIMDPLDYGAFHVRKMLHHDEAMRDKYLIVKSIFLTYPQFFYAEFLAAIFISGLLLSK